MSKTVDHTRALRQTSEGKRVYEKKRGLRELKFDGEAAAFSDDEPAKKARFLIGAAQRILARVGVQSFDQVLEDAKSSTANDQETRDSHALGSWLAAIIHKYGAFSPVTLAAQFLINQRAIVTSLVSHVEGAEKDQIPDEVYDRFVDGMPELFKSVYALCDAWYWLRLELEGNHARLIQAKNAAEARQKGANTAKAMATERSGIIAEALGKRASLKGKPVSFIAKNIRSEVEAAFKAAGIEPDADQSAQAFERMVRRALRK